MGWISTQVYQCWRSGCFECVSQHGNQKGLKIHSSRNYMKTRLCAVLLGTGSTCHVLQRNGETKEMTCMRSVADMEKQPFGPRTLSHGQLFASSLMALIILGSLCIKMPARMHGSGWLKKKTQKPKPVLSCCLPPSHLPEIRS